MIEKNKEIMEFLEYYSAMTIAPQYAVMINGKWGTGKTWFIENYIEGLESEEKKVLYVSLYGITDVQQIEDEFFRQLHPVLSSKSVAFAGKLFKGLVKGALKIDLNADGKDDGTVSIGTPDLKLPDYLKNTNGLVLVFDDLERCSMPTSSILGYINYFVEHDGRKVVLVCNEEALITAEDAIENNVETRYIRIKEKLIGKTFLIEPDFDAAFRNFLNDINLDSTRDALLKQVENIKRMYVNADYKNLRHLRQAILDFSRLVELLDVKYLKNEELIAHLLTFFLLYSFEIKNGSLAPRGISQIEASLYTSIGTNDENLKNSIYRKLSEKYGDININDCLLPVSIWESIFDTGLFNKTEIDEALGRSKYFLLDNQPLWVTLWNMHNLTDDELDLILEKVDKRLFEKKVESVGELKQLVSSLLYLSEQKIYKRAEADIIEIGKDTAKILAEKEGFAVENSARGIYDQRESGFGGYGYHEKDSANFRSFVQSANDILQKNVEDGYPDRANRLLELMASDINEFTGALVHDNYRKADYCGIPILAFIVTENFVKAIGSLHSNQLRQVHHMIDERYASDHYRKLLKKESHWLRDTATGISALLDLRTGKLSSISLRNLRDAMLRAADALEQS